MCMLYIQSIPSMPYGSMGMAIGWNGLSMPTKECSVCMPIVINLKVSGVGQDSVPYMMEIILTHITVKCGVVDLDEYRFFYDVEVVWGGAISCLSAVCMDG